MSTSLPAQQIGPAMGRNAGFDSLAGKLQALRGAAAAATPEERERQRMELHTAAQDFEAMFLNLLLNEMRPKDEGGLFGEGLGSDIYEELFDTELAKAMSRTGQLGLAEMIERQVAQTIGLEEDDGIIPGESLSRPLPQPLRFTAMNAYKAAGEPAGSLSSLLLKPVDGDLSSPFGPRIDPIDGVLRDHHGIDLAAPKGSPVNAAAEGKVIFSGTKPGYGNTVIIEHREGYETLYAHNDNNLVRKGEEVDAGQVVASVGETGRATGPHLHFEVRKHGVAIDPVDFLQ